MPMSGIKKSIPIKGVVIGVVALAVIIATIALPKIYLKTLDFKLSSLQKEINSDKYTEIKRINNDIITVTGSIDTKQAIISYVDNLSYPVSDVFATLRHIAPTGIEVNTVSYDSNKLNISVKAQDVIQLHEFIENVKRIEFLSLSNSMSSISFSSNGSTSLSFDVGRKVGQ